MRLVKALLNSTFRWLDKTPTSRVIARCTEDIQAVDGSISNQVGWMVEITLSMLIHLAAVMIFTPVFILP
jgi:ABC-type multidrug transport system fused ATPase/permease subunit